MHHDLSLYTHLALTVRPSGEPQTWRHWFVNIQTDGPVRSDLFQHRLPLPTSPSAANKWHTLHIPLSSFVLTNSGALSETQIGMMKNKVRTVGFSILGSERVQEESSSSEDDEEAVMDGAPGIPRDERRVEGPGMEGMYELGVRRVEAVRKEDDELV
ncbi:hypothetical protein QFC19_008959 [Naganishia cerealis]|uniref:Uncharacterized protein n=1 Tax=Naganishia cerealis TaxID=610337 RepID=A0ACC2UXE9_9TREE|nr:hypothetical protein QFC19_008959 [Naganishia cerealis]